MELLRDGIDRVPASVATAISVGAYDGIHRGHRSVLSTLCDLAAERGLDPAVVTFDQHPAAVLRPENAPLLLTDHEQRMELFADIGLAWLYLLRFDEARAQTTSEQFVEQVLVGAMNASLIVVGEDFHFGKGRSGSVESLEEMGERLGFEVIGLDLLGDDDAVEPISSTAIRRALVGGDIDAVNSMLGRRFEVRGEVITGDQRGRTIGFPTANIAFEDGRAWPAKGVYAAWVDLPDGRRVPSAVNIGMRPTFHQHAERPLLEAHLIDFDDDLYGQRIHVRFEAFLRSEQRFSGIDEISAQLKKDVEAARAVLAESA
ncbi:MAG: bifunctional riboflavin kinase/FAD synthetase [Actinomycetota bacterium]